VIPRLRCRYPDTVQPMNELTRDELVRRLAEVSHATYLRQKARNDPPAHATGQEVTAHDRERAEDTVRELERLGIWATKE
jgi:hypothetical protein